MANLPSNVSKIAVLFYGEYRTFDMCVKRMKFLYDQRIDIYFNTWNTTSYFIPGLVDVTENVTTERILTSLSGRTHPDSKIVLSVQQSPYENYDSQCNMIYSWINGINMIKNSEIIYDNILLIRPDLLFESNNTIVIDDFLVRNGNLGIPQPPDSALNTHERNKLLERRKKSLESNEDMMVLAPKEDINIVNNTHDRMIHLDMMLDTSRPIKKTRGIYDIFFSASSDIIFKVFNEDMLNLWLLKGYRYPFIKGYHWHQWIYHYLFTFDVPKVFINDRHQQIVTNAICRFYSDETISVARANEINVDWTDLKHYKFWYPKYLEKITIPESVENRLVKIIKKMEEGYYDKYRVSKTTQQ